MSPLLLLINAEVFAPCPEARGARDDQDQNCPDELAPLNYTPGRAGRSDPVIMLALAESVSLRKYLKGKVSHAQE